MIEGSVSDFECLGILATRMAMDIQGEKVKAS